MIADYTFTPNTLEYASLGLPILIGLALKAYHARWFKALVMLVGTALLALLKAVIDKQGILDSQMLNDWVRSTVLAVVSYYGVVGPLGVGNLAPGTGIPGPVEGTSGPVNTQPIPDDLP